MITSRRGGGGGGGGCGGASLDGGDELAALFGSTLQLAPGRDNRFDPVLHAARGAVLGEAVEAAERAVRYQPRFDEVKIRFNFGAALFYRGPRDGETLSIRQLKGRAIPGDMKAVFSNGVGAAARAALLARLTGRLGFKLVERKERVSLHLEEMGRNAGHALSLTKSPSGALSLRKVKSAANKLAFLTLLDGRPSAPDFRAKLIAHYQPSGAAAARGPPLERIASAARLAGRGGAPRLEVPDLCDYDLKVSRERHKSKEVYEGCYEGLAIKVTFSRVWSPDKGAAHAEVTGACPELTALLAAALAAHALAPGDAARLRRGLETLLGFATDVAAAAAAAGA
ncbi:MAG: hypothetical protein J3K34DRAFT_3294 [Monoraphidium minutum]|nr:MAG: hypothetical protein J3K34DRAFT_3294 [Monoraphidium minutum]